MPGFGEVVGKLECSYSPDIIVKQFNFFGKQFGGFKIVKHISSIDSAIPLEEKKKHIFIQRLV